MQIQGNSGPFGSNTSGNFVGSIYTGNHLESMCISSDGGILQLE